MTDLTGKQIANTYKQLLKVAVSTNTGVSTALQTVQSGDGTNSALRIGTGGVAIAGSLSVTAFNVGSFTADNVNVSACLSATNIVAATGSFTSKVSGAAAEFSGNVSVGASIYAAGAVYTGTVSAAYFAGDGSNLTGTTPTGAILPYAVSAAPTGFLLCNGQAVSRTTYSTLFAVVSSLYGDGNGSSTFNVPDLRGRFLAGWDAGTSVLTLSLIHI